MRLGWATRAGVCRASGGSYRAPLRVRRLRAGARPSAPAFVRAQSRAADPPGLPCGDHQPRITDGSHRSHVIGTHRKGSVMAHHQQIEFCKSVKNQFPHFFSGRFVIDRGSVDINGNNQYLFNDCLYIGVDLLPGRNVDLASKGHDLNLPNESVDVVISTECLEHDQFYALTLRNITRMLKPGGLFLFSCATSGRAEHGTRRTTPQDAPLTQGFGEWSDYYKNLEEGDIRQVLDIEFLFESHAFLVNAESCDLYFWGIKRGALINRYDYSFQIQQPTLRSHLREREELVTRLLETLSGRNEQIGHLDRALAERNGQIANLNRALAERNGRIGSIDQALAERDEQIVSLNQAVAERDGQIASLNQAVAERDGRMTRSH
jgi:SAM-dependent methyltransferase